MFMRSFTSRKKRSTSKKVPIPRRSPWTTFRPRLELLEDRTVPAQFLVTSSLDDGSDGTLRWAINQANLTAAADNIEFRIDSGFQSIALSSILPDITYPVT